jgi:hypothetical protein
MVTFSAEQKLPLPTLSIIVLVSAHVTIKWGTGLKHQGHPGHEVDHLHPSIGEVKNACIYISTPAHVHLAMYLTTRIT